MQLARAQGSTQDFASNMKKAQSQLTSAEADVTITRNTPASLISKDESSRRKTLPPLDVQPVESSEYHWAYKNGATAVVEKSINSKTTDGVKRTVAMTVRYLAKGSSGFIFTVPDDPTDKFSSGQINTSDVMAFTSPMDFGYRLYSSEGRDIPLSDSIEGGFDIVGRSTDAKWGRIVEVQVYCKPAAGAILFQGSDKLPDGVEVDVMRHMWVAIDRNYIVTRLEDSYPIFNHKTPTQSKLFSSWVIDEMQNVNGVWFPTNSSYTQYDQDGGVVQSDSLQMSNIDINHANDDLFSTSFRPGMHVWNELTQRGYYADQGGNLQADLAWKKPGPIATIARTEYPKRWIFILVLTIGLASLFLGLRRWISARA